MSRKNQIIKLAAIVTKAFSLRSKLSYHTNLCYQIFKQIDKDCLFTITPSLIKKHFNILESQQDIASFFRHHRINSSSFSYIDFFKAFFENKMRIKNENSVSDLIKNLLEQELLLVKSYQELSALDKNQQLIKYIEDNQKLHRDPLIEYTWSLIEVDSGIKPAGQLKRDPFHQLSPKETNNNPNKINYLEEIKQLQVQYRQKKKIFEQFEQDAKVIQKRLELIMDQAVKNIDNVVQIKANPIPQINQISFGQKQKPPLGLRSANNFYPIPQQNYSTTTHLKSNHIQNNHITHQNNQTGKLSPRINKVFLNQGYYINDFSNQCKQNIQMDSRFREPFKNQSGINFNPQINKPMSYKLGYKQQLKQIYNPSQTGFKNESYYYRQPSYSQELYNKDIYHKQSQLALGNSSQNYCKQHFCQPQQTLYTFKPYRHKYLQQINQQESYHQQHYPSANHQQPYIQQAYHNPIYTQQIKEYHQNANHYKIKYGQVRQSRVSPQKYLMEKFKERMNNPRLIENQNQRMVSSMSQPKKFNPYRDNNSGLLIRNEFYKRKYKKQTQQRRNYNIRINRVKSQKLF